MRERERKRLESADGVGQEEDQRDILRRFFLAEMDVDPLATGLSLAARASRTLLEVV